MENNHRKTGVKKRQNETVPAAVWLVTGVLVLCVVLFAHSLPEAKTAKELEYFNAERLKRFSSKPIRPLRVVVVGSSLSMCALFFDEEMEQLARENGLPSLEFVRFIKLDARLMDFAPLLDPIIKAGPDLVFFESSQFILGPKDAGDNGLKRLFFFAEDTGNDDRKKLKEFFQEQFSRFRKKAASTKKENPNVPVSEKKVLIALRQRQVQSDFELLQEEREERQELRQFAVPEEYKVFFEALRQKHITGVLLGLPLAQEFGSAYPPEMMSGIPGLIKRYQEVFGLQYLEYPEALGLEYFKDFTHLNEQGRVTYSTWFLSELPVLVKKGRTP